MKHIFFIGILVVLILVFGRAFGRDEELYDLLFDGGGVQESAHHFVVLKNRIE